MSLRPVPCLRIVALIVLLMGWEVGEAHAQPAFLAKDVNTTRPRALGNPQQVPLAVLGSTLFYVADDGGRGQELWKLDTVTGATSIVKDICPGSCPSYPNHVTEWNGSLYFTAWDGAHGNELWKSDGTEAGTVLLRDLVPGLDSSASFWLAVVDDELFFDADDGIHGRELWATDGTGAGMRLVADIHPGRASSFPFFMAASGGKLLLHADDGSHGVEPWISDGTEAGTSLLRELATGTVPTLNLSDQAQVLPDGAIVFTAQDQGHGFELWRTDGTEAGTTLVKDIYPGPQGSWPEAFRLLNGKVYFSAETEPHGRELWVTDGTAAGTVLVKDINPGAGGSHPGGNLTGLHVAQGQLYFSTVLGLWKSDGTSDGTVSVTDEIPLIIGTSGSSVIFFPYPFHTDLRVFRTDGTEAGTVELKNLGSQTSDCSFDSEAPHEVNGVFYFYTCPPNTGQQLWRSDGTVAGTFLVHSPTRTPSFPVPQTTGPDSLLAPLENRLYFIANEDWNPYIWHTDGSSAGTQRFSFWIGTSWLSPPPLPGNSVRLGDSLLYAGSKLSKLQGDGTLQELPAYVVPPSFVSSGDRVFFQSYTPEAGNELWKSDGTEAGTSLVKDIYPGVTSSGLSFRASLGPLVLFDAYDGVSGWTWRSDGTAAGTFPLKNVHIGSSVVLNGPTLLFLESGSSQNLWKTDGTPEGTVVVKSFAAPPQQFGNFRGLMSLGNRAVFSFHDGVHGWELWTSDGTEAGTHLIKDIRPGAESPFGVHGGFLSAVVQDRLIFVADDGIHGRELWVTDGTEAGTRMTKDIFPGPEPSLSQTLWRSAAMGNRLFFVAGDGAHGQELWVSDGTEAGTRMVKDLAPGVASATILELTVIGDRLAFSASDGIHGAEPWVTNGTEVGTRMIQDIAPGPASSGPWRFSATSRHVHFIADGGTTGTELWAFPLGFLSSRFLDVPSNFWAWRFVEALAAAGLTTGCGGGNYCPSLPVTRAEMAVFLEQGIHGAGFFPPPPTGTRFQDVPANYWAGAWIEQLAADGLTGGCSVTPPLFCPAGQVDRAQMAVFLLQALHGVGYVPPPATGTRFADVPANHWAAAWIEQFAREGITAGCTPDRYCPDTPVPRDQMAVFLTLTFGLPLP